MIDVTISNENLPKGHEYIEFHLSDAMAYIHERTVKRETELINHIDNLHGCIDAVLVMLAEMVSPVRLENIQQIQKIKKSLYREIEGFPEASMPPPPPPPPARKVIREGHPPMKFTPTEARK